MRVNKRNLIALGFVILMWITSCELPYISTPTPFVFPTPNLTMTAIFAPTIPPLPTFTPPMVQTATPGAVTATILPTGVSPTDTPTSVPTDTSIPRSTETPVPKPTKTKKPPTATVVIPDKRSGESIPAVYLKKSPKINGNLNDWDLPSYEIDKVVFGASHYDGEGDLSGSVMLGWDDEYLYIAARVTDNKYVQQASGKYLYKGDSVEFLIDTQVQADYYVDWLTNDDYQLGFSPGSPDPGDDPEAYLWYPSGISGSRTKVKIDANKTQRGYRFEAAVPWDILDVDPQAGQHFGFAISISDNDRKGKTVQQSMVSNVSSRIFLDPTTWGDLTLVKK